MVDARYRYDNQHQLIRVEQRNAQTPQRAGQQIRYRYDALGRRIAKYTEDTETRFLWDGDVLVGETRIPRTPPPQAVGNAALAPQPQAEPIPIHYVYEPGTFQPICQLRGRSVYYYHTDHLGTPLELTDIGGNTVWSARYKAYGKVDYFINTLENPLRFPGQYYDEETGLHYNRHRYYDPECGQFITQDPIGLLGGVNPYQYAPNPVGWVDPLGLNRGCPQEEPKSIRQRLREAGPGTEYGLPGGKNRSGPFRYRPPRGYNPSNPLPTGKNGGYLDRFGNEWVQGPYHGDPKKGYQFEWDVRLTQQGEKHWNRYGAAMRRADDGGKYINVAPDGMLSH